MDERVQRTPYAKLFWTLLIGFCFVYLTYSLGQWQTGRAEEKQALVAEQARALAASPITPTSPTLDLDNLSYRKIEVRGRFDAKALIYIDNRQVNGRPAVQVVQGFQPQGEQFLIPVDRGYLLRDPRDPRLAPEMPANAEAGLEIEVDANGFDEVELTGTVLPRFAQAAELSGMALGDVKDIHQAESNGMRVWSNFNAEAFAELTALPLSNFVVTLQPVEQSPMDGQGSQANQANKVQGFYHQAVSLQAQVAKHQGYAFQWYTMSIVLLLLTGFFVYKEFYKGRTT